jgi:phosphate transport system substrate-binding protein
VLQRILANRYKIVKRLGHGGFGETYLAEDIQRFNSWCVVKQLRPHFTNSSRFEIVKKLFEREAKTLKKLGDEHQQIPQLLAYFVENEGFYLVQEFIPGDDFAKLLTQRQKLSEIETINLLIKVLKILIFVHENDVIHRDIKPANLIQGEQDGKIVLIDFGAVKENLAEPSTTIIGTLGYMSPEQAQGNPQLCSDIYALGMLGIETLTGVRPHLLTRNTGTDEIRELTQINVSSNLVKVLNKMVKTDLNQRYQTASSVLQEMEQLNHDIRETKPPTINNISLLGKHSFFRLPIVVKAALIIIIAPGLIWGLYTWINNYSPLVCMLNQVPDGKFSYSGSTTWTPFREKVENSIKNVCPNFELSFIRHTYGQSASQFGIKRLLDGQSDFSISSRSIADKEYEEAGKRGIELKQIPIAFDATSVAVNINLNLPKSGLTISELRDIMTGKVTNWKQLGEPRDLPITVYQGENSSHTHIIKQTILNGQEFLKNSNPALSITEAIQKVQNDEGGIYISSAAHLVTQCSIKTLPLGENKLVPPYQEPLVPPDKCTKQHKNKPNAVAFRSGEYRPTNRLFVIMKKDGDRSQKAGEAFANLLLTSPRQELIEQAGFVRIK